MSTKMKGLLKGLRYISQIFDNEKEQEMEIGYPTDVKHVAHIGWDGPSMGSSEVNSDSKEHHSEARDAPDLPKSSRRQSASGAQITGNSDQSDAPKRSRRHHSSSSTSSLPREGTARTKPSRQARESGQGCDSPSHNTEAPKKNKPKKTKDPSKESAGSTRPRTKSQPSTLSDSETGPCSRFQTNESCQTSTHLETSGEQEDKKCNEIS